MTDLLLEVQRLQTVDRPQAERVLAGFVRSLFDLNVVRVELRSSNVSLNSMNGLLELDDGRTLFFKTHTEPDSRIDEYYNSSLLKAAGYPVVEPILSSTESGRQFLVYEMVDAPTMFDTAWLVECGDDYLLPALADAQLKLDQKVVDIQRGTLAWQDAEVAAAAPVHQLFFHRLSGRRLQDFLGQERIYETDHAPLHIDTIRRSTLTVNGQIYSQSLDELIEDAIDVLRPERSGPSVVGHGDSHNGNVFFRGAGRCPQYFDPAFAGRHHPLLDVVKPLYHNVFAMWMYFPVVKHRETHLRVVEDDTGRLHVDHDYSLHPVRQMFLRSKFVNLVIPIVCELSSRGWLRQDWRRYVKSALLCCPLLTVNFNDSTKYSDKIALLALSSAVEMGGESEGKRSMIDQLLDEVEAAVTVHKTSAPQLRQPAGPS